MTVSGSRDPAPVLRTSATYRRFGLQYWLSMALPPHPAEEQPTDVRLRVSDHTGWVPFHLCASGVNPMCGDGSVGDHAQVSVQFRFWASGNDSHTRSQMHVRLQVGR
jgi:hypothetical protein